MIDSKKGSQPGFFGVLPQEPLRRFAVGVDPELLERPLDQQFGPVADPLRRGMRVGEDKGTVACLGQPGEPPRHRLGPARACDAEHEQLPRLVQRSTALRLAQALELAVTAVRRFLSHLLAG